MNTKIIGIALGEIGVKEIPGTKDNPEVLKYFNEIGFDGAKLKDETAWCSAFANWVAKKANLRHSKKLNARSWLQVGTAVTTPEIGDVVVFWRGSKKSWQGHVAFFIRETQDWVYVLGGNQSNQVKISAYPKERVLGYRKL
jgi:uncharacterized protein (TIGR02594 family)